MQIGGLKLDNPFFLAPLAGITDAPMRRLCHEQGAALTYSEMISAKGLWYGDKNTGKLTFTYADEGPTAFQIFGREPEVVAFAARALTGGASGQSTDARAASRPAPVGDASGSACVPALLDINMGCPVPKIVRNGEGSALLKDPDLIYDVVAAAVKNSSVPVTAKIRIGWDAGSINALETAHAIEAAGAAAVAVHGRTREQYYSGKADWSAIAAVKRAVNIPVIGNGDVNCGADALRMLQETGCDFVMIARGALGNPWIFRDALALWRGEELPPPPQTAEKREMMLRHLADLAALKGDYAAVREMRKHVGWYLKGIKGAAAFRGKVNQIDDLGELRAAIDSLT